MTVSSPPPGLRPRFVADQYVFLPGFIPPDDARAFEQEARAYESRRASLAAEEDSWEQLSVPADSALHRLMHSPRIFELIGTAFGLERFPDRHKSVLGINRYRTGEFINPHKDVSGTVNIILSLDRSPGAVGGAFVVRPHGEDIAFEFAAGDAFLFCATAMLHWTTPLVASSRCPAPQRVVAITKYQFDAKG